MFPWLPTSPTDLTIRPWDGVLPHAAPSDRESSSTSLATVIDTETTGTGADARVIELGALTFAYDRNTGVVLGEVERYGSLHDPGVSIPAEVSKLTGITADDVRGHAIDIDRVRMMIANSAIVLAHRAGFDRPHVEALTGPMRARWACSCEQIDWRGHGLPSASLVALTWAHGFYTTAHRAMGDVTALVRLLGTVNADTGRTYLAELLEAARVPMVVIDAWGAPIERKDLLRDRGYRWDAKRRVWSREMRETEADNDWQWLKSDVYESPEDCEADIYPLDPYRRFARGA